MERRELLAATPIISELLASNSDGLRDSDGDSSDWIELYNPTPAAVNLQGWRLTDNAAKLSQWVFPDVVLGANDFLTVFASGKNRAVAGQPLHTNFKLGGDGEFLALVEPDGTIASQYAPNYPPQATNISYGVGFSTSDLVGKGSVAKVLVPSDGSLGTNWQSPAFDDAAWISGPLGVGFGVREPGFDVTYVETNEYLENLDIALGVLASPDRQILNVQVTSPAVNFLGTGSGSHFAGDLAFPTQSIGDDYNNFVIEAKTKVTIPSSGPWSFGVNSDDGFRLTLQRNGASFSSQYQWGRAPDDTIQTFNIPEPGDYDVDLVMFEGYGGSSVELFAAPGDFGTFDGANGAFRLVGDSAAGGLLASIDRASGPDALVHTDIQASMSGVNASAYVRVPFTMNDPSDVDALRLNIRYDDGFVAYINGVEVARRDAPSGLTFDASATTKRDSLDVVAPEGIVLPAEAVSALRAGTNVLAIQGMNSSRNDPSFLVLPELVGSRVFPEDVGYFSTPTPKAPNQNPCEGIVQRVAATVAAGFYDTPQTVSLSTPTPDATIRYTLDGSTPSDSHGTIYSEPIIISGTSNLRAIAYRDRYVALPSITRTYVFLDDVLRQSNQGETPSGWPVDWGANTVDYGIDPDIVTLEGSQRVKDALKTIPTWSITTDLNNLFDPASGIYANPWQDGRDWERPASVEMFNPDGSVSAPNSGSGFQVNAGIRIRGGFSRSTDNPKHSFRLFFRGSYGDSTLEYPLFGTEGASTFKKIDLRTSQNYSWNFDGYSNNNFVADVLARYMQRDMGQPYTRSTWLHLYINGQYWGLYETQERPEAEYAATYFGGAAADYDVIKPEAGPYANYATDGNMDAYTRLWEQARAKLPDGTPAFALQENFLKAQGKNPDGTDNPNYELLLDVDNLIVYMIGILWSGNLDAPISNFLGNAYVNNYYAVRDRNGRQGFRFFQHDAEHTMRDLSINRNGPWTDANFENSPDYFNPQWLHQQLMANLEYRTRFADMVQSAFVNDGPLSTDHLAALAKGEAAKIDQAIIGESARWGDAKNPNPQTRADWLRAVSDVVDNYIGGRQAIFISQLRTTVLGTTPPRSAPLFPALDAPQPIVNGQKQHGGAVPPGSSLRFAATGGEVYYTTDGTDPRLPGGSVNPAASVYDTTSTTSTLVSQGAVWKYNASGLDLGSAWREVAYEDSDWPSGPAELGYGDGGEATVVPFGPDANDKYITTYFRREFDLALLDGVTSLDLRLKRDDGAVVYINGVEAVRTNMPQGTITASTLAAAAAADDGQDFIEFAVDPGLLRKGRNVIAIEVHQVSGTNRDISFDASLDLSVQSAPAIPITGKMSLAARVRDAQGSWSALDRADFNTALVPASAVNLRITELQYNPAAPPAGLPAPLDDAQNYEFIELRNISNAAISLDGVRFSEGVLYDFSRGSVHWLLPGQCVLVVKNQQAFEARYGTGLPVTGNYDTSNLSNGGEKLVLLDADGKTIQSFKFDDEPGSTPPWPTTPDGHGPSLTIRRTSLDYNLGSSWRPSFVDGGTPGIEEDDAPDGLSLSSTSVVEEIAGAKVGDILASDPDDLDTFVYSLVPGGDAAQFAVIDNELRVGTQGLDFESGATRTVTLRVTDAAGATFDKIFTLDVVDVNDRPNFTAANPPEVDEDSGQQTIADWVSSFIAGPASESTQHVLRYYVREVSNPAMFQAEPTVSADGTLAYTLSADANGTSTFQVTVQDDGGTGGGGMDTSLPQTFTISVNAVNDPPGFTADNPPEIDQDSGLQSVTNWVTEFSPGPVDESGQQALRYTVSDVTNPGLFAVLPSVTPGGTLIYMPLARAFGIATFTVIVQDDGGVDRRGDDVSPAQTFTIVVNPVVQLPGGKGANSVVVSRIGQDVQVLNNNREPALFRGAVGTFQKLTILGVANKSDHLTIDRGAGDIPIPDGVVFHGGPGRLADTLLIRGTKNAEAFQSNPGSATVDSITVAFTGVEQLTFDGMAGDDSYAISALSTKTVIADSMGTDRLDFSGAATGITLDLAKSASQLQRIFGSASATTLALKGVFENAVGTPQADVIRGNSAANDIRGGAGNDAIWGGAGNDVLSGEDGDDWLYGEAGDDRLFGGPGNNVLLGSDGKDLLDVADSSGRNLLIGGRDADSLTGGAGQDILIGGTTSHDANPTALAALIEQWASGADDTFADRCNLLESGVRLGKKRIALNASSTVLNDKIADTLFGGAGHDWFFAFPYDDASDRTTPEDR